MKSVLVTGASRGIGAAIVRYLLMHGLHVIGIARDETGLKMLSLEKIGGGGRFEYVAGCVTDREVVGKAVAMATSSYELLGVVLNAGAVEPIVRVSDVALDSFSLIMDINFGANLAICQLTIPHLRQTHGSIVVLTSGIVEYPTPSMAPYACSKAALNTLCQVLALEEPDITVVAVRPGLVDTRMLDVLVGRKGVLGAAQEQFLDETPRLETWVPAERIGNLIISGHEHKDLSGKIIDYHFIP